MTFSTFGNIIDPMRDWLHRIITPDEMRAVLWAMFGIGLCLAILAAFSGLWQAGVPAAALLLLAGVIWLARADDRG